MNDQEITLICPYCENSALQRHLGEEKSFYSEEDGDEYSEEVEYIWQCEFCYAEWSCPPGHNLEKHAVILKDGRKDIIENFNKREGISYLEAQELGLRWR